MRQITVTERNEWEGETFSYILSVDDTTLSSIREGLEDKSNVKIDIDTNYTPETIKLLNKESRNTYMSRYQFNELKLPTGEFDWYDDIFYKAVGLTRL